jgi:DNA-binding transcriptional regulator YiaG
MSNLKRLNGLAFKALYKEELALSQPQIARALGYTTRQVRNLENSEGELRPVIVLAMEALLSRSRKCEKISANNSCRLENNS